MGGGVKTVQNPYSGTTQNTFGYQSMPGIDPNKAVSDFQNFDINIDPGAEQRKALRDQSTENRWNNDFTSGIPSQLRMALQSQDQRANQQMSDYERQNALYAKSGMELARKQSLLPQLTQTGGSSQGYQSQSFQQPSILQSVIGAAGQVGAGYMMSDPRLKDIKGNSEAGLDEVKRLHPIVYKYKQGTGLDQEQHTGLNAKEVEQTIPSAVSRVAGTEPDADENSGPSDGDADNSPMRAIHMEKVQSALVNSVKELAGHVEDLKKHAAIHHRPRIRKV